MSFSFNVNNRMLGTGSGSTFYFGQTLLDLKAHLVQNGWTVSASGTYHGQLNILQYSQSDILTNLTEGANSIGNDVSWFVIKDPDDKRQFLFLKNRVQYITGFFLAGGFKVTGSQSQAISSYFIDCPETYTQATPSDTPVITPAKAFVYTCKNDFEFNGGVCKSGFKWDDASDVEVLIDGKVNGIDTPVYVSSPPYSHAGFIQDNCGTNYRVYDGYILNNTRTIGAGFFDDGQSSGTVSATKNTSPIVFCNGKIVGGIAGFHIDSGFQIVNGVRTAVSNIDINPEFICIDGSWVDDNSYNQPLTNVILVSKWVTFDKCYVTNYSTDLSTCSIQIGSQAFELSNPVAHMLNPICDYQFAVTPDAGTQALIGYCIGHINFALPVGTLTDIAGTDNNGAYVPGFIQEFVGSLVIDGFQISSGHVIRDTKYIYDEYIDLTEKSYITNGYVGNGNICYANSAQSNSNLCIAYSANAGFDLAHGFYGAAVSATNPPTAADMVWLHKKDTHTGYGYKADVNGDYFPNNIRGGVSLLNPGFPDTFFDQDDFDIYQPTNYMQNINSYDVWNYHMAVNTVAPYEFYLMLTCRNQIFGLIAMDSVYNKNVDNADDVVLLNICNSPGMRFGASHHSKYIKSWYGDNSTIVSRPDFVSAMTSSSARFLETGVLYQSFYQEPNNHTSLDLSLPNTIIDLSTSDFVLTSQVQSIVVVSGAHSVILPTSPYFNQEISITNITSDVINVTSSNGIGSYTSTSTSIPPMHSLVLSFTSKFWLVDVFYSYVADYTLLPQSPNVNGPSASYDMSALPFEFYIDVLSTTGNNTVSLPAVPYPGQIINIRNPKNVMITIDGNGKIIDEAPISMLFPTKSLYVCFNGIKWISTLPTAILNPLPININTFVFPSGAKKVADRFAQLIGSVSTIPAQSGSGKLKLNSQPIKNELVCISNQTTLHQNIYGVSQKMDVNGVLQTIGYPIGSAKGITLPPGDDVILQFNEDNQIWVINKFSSAIPSNLQGNLTDSLETLMTLVYAKIENPNITNDTNIIPNSYRGMSTLFQQDTVKRYDLEMIDVGTDYFVSLNLASDSTPISCDDSGCTTLLPWVDNTPINPE